MTTPNASSSSHGPRLLCIELNEFNAAYLTEMAERLDLPHVRRMLGMSHSTTLSPDLVERHGLDPWVQWVSIHCGQPVSVHGTMRLGDTRTQKAPQLWHEVAKRGYTWGVWSPMNAPLGDETGCAFYMPDPWSFEETPRPKALEDLLALPRYAARNYTDINYGEAFAAALRLVRFLAPPKHWSMIMRFVAQASPAVLSTGPNVHTFATLLDYLCTLYFVKLRREHRPNLSLIFLNHIAHLQHQFWKPGSEPHPEMRLGLGMCDAILGLLFEDLQAGEAIVVMNGLVQTNVANQGAFVYRQRNPQHAIEMLGIKGGKVEQNMTHDATVLFTDSAQADEAFALLDACKLSDGHKAFEVERQGPYRVFYELAFEHDVAKSTSLTSGSYEEPFYDVFQLVCERTGAHLPNGDVYFDGIEVPSHLPNHEMFQVLLAHFDAHVQAARGTAGAQAAQATA